MENVLHWIGVAVGLLVIAGGVSFFLRGLTLKPSDPPPRVPGKVRHRVK
jgi:hypothetical protein